MPQANNFHRIRTGAVVDVVSGALKSYTSNAGKLDVGRLRANVWVRGYQLEGTLELGSKQTGGCLTMFDPPIVGLPDLAGRRGRNDQPQS